MTWHSKNAMSHFLEPNIEKLSTPSQNHQKAHLSVYFTYKKLYTQSHPTKVLTRTLRKLISIPLFFKSRYRSQMITYLCLNLFDLLIEGIQVLYIWEKFTRTPWERCICQYWFIYTFLPTVAAFSIPSNNLPCLLHLRGACI